MIFYKVILAIGPDKPGIISTVSAFLTERNCNIEDSRMSIIGEEFALFLLFSGPFNSIEKVKNDIKGLEQKSGLTVLLKDTKPPKNKGKEPAIPYKIDVIGMDHPGIVNEITGIFHKNNINVVNLESDVSNAPVSGTALFHMHIKIDVPVSLSISALKEELAKAEKHSNLNIALSAIEP